MKAGRLFRIGADVTPDTLDRYGLDICVTNGGNSKRPTRAQRQELERAVDLAVASLDDAFGQFM
jgi:hypothetical protein